MPEDICLACGLCCNGVIFAHVKLQPSEGEAFTLDAGGLLVMARLRLHF